MASQRIYASYNSEMSTLKIPVFGSVVLSTPLPPNRVSAGIIYLFIYFFSAQGTQFPRAVNIEKEMKHAWKGHGADSEIGNVSARQAALNIYLFIYLK